MKTKSIKQVVKDHGYFTWPCGGRKYALFEISTRKSLGAFPSQAAAFKVALDLPQLGANHNTITIKR